MRRGRLFRTNSLDTVPILESKQEVIVTEIERKTEQRDSLSRDHRSQYSTPTLKEFGPVGVLTQGGSGGGSEMASMLAADMA